MNKKGIKSKKMVKIMNLKNKIKNQINKKKINVNKNNKFQNNE